MINSASNFEISIKDTFDLIREIMNADVSVFSDEKRLRPELSEVNRLFGDNSLLKELTDWRPSYDGLKGLKIALK